MKSNPLNLRPQAIKPKESDLKLARELHSLHCLKACKIPDWDSLSVTGTSFWLLKAIRKNRKYNAKQKSN